MKSPRPCGVSLLWTRYSVGFDISKLSTQKGGYQASLIHSDSPMPLIYPYLFSAFHTRSNKSSKYGGIDLFPCSHS